MEELLPGNGGWEQNNHEEILDVMRILLEEIHAINDGTKRNEHIVRGGS